MTTVVYNNPTVDVALHWFETGYNDRIAGRPYRTVLDNKLSRHYCNGRIHAQVHVRMLARLRRLTMSKTQFRKLHRTRQRSDW